MLADSQTYPICTQNFKQIGPPVSEEFDFKHRDTRFLYIRFYCTNFPSRFASGITYLYKSDYIQHSLTN